MKLRRILFLSGALLLAIVVFAMDIVRRNVELEIGGLSLFRDLLVAAIFFLVYLFLESSSIRREPNPVKKLGLMMIASFLMLGLGLSLALTGGEGFDAKNYSLLPLGFGTVFLATLVSILFGIFAVLVIRPLRDLVYFKPKAGTRRNFLLFSGFVFAASGSTIVLKPLETSVITGVLFGLAVLLAVINSFRQSWIVYMTKREKIFALIYGFFLFCGFIGLNVLIQSSFISRSLLYYSYPLKQFVTTACIFGNIYAGMAFVSTLFHLPTAEAFDRKASEVSSLHNLSRLVTQVFNFDELVDTVTTMTLQVCEAKSCWLEIIHEHDLKEESRKVHDGSGSPSKPYTAHVVAMKNMTQAQLDELFSLEEHPLRELVLEERSTVVVDDVAKDSRLERFRRKKYPFGSLVVVPLISHNGIVGILYATKDAAYQFFKDDVDVISAFADQATIALENSRLIEKSLERERLLREMMVAQDMQKRLLPQVLPSHHTIEIDAISTPAFEVGGDYYDFVQLDNEHLGIVVGDVSGKGVSAAFYMSEVKGIFQALSRMYPSPKEFMIKANDALVGSMDKRSFVSLIYGVLNTRTGQLTISRAGHCPMLLVSEGRVEYIRPTGMGIGLGKQTVFASAIEEQSLQLQQGDVCLFFTDGVTEAQREGMEFGYERLLDAARLSVSRSAAEIKQHIVTTVRSFTDPQPNHDDLTLVVVKWKGTPHPASAMHV